MADAERLELTLRNRNTHREWTEHPIQVMEDPDDYTAILKHLGPLARDLEGYRGDDLSGYELRVCGVDRAWRDFRLPGKSK